jgi:ABC-2 type transport system ATP-binding protein
MADVMERSRLKARMEPIIQVVDLVKRYKTGEKNAVDGVTFDVQPGEFFALLGPNGAGKTTTISILTTTLAPTSGTVRIAGHNIETAASDVRRQVGIIFQNPSLDVNLTAEENVRLHAALYGLYPFMPTYALMPAAYKKQLGELGAVLGIGDEMFKPIRTFSGGMKRKLEIVRSLIHKPRVLFLDEPTTGLDPVSRRSLWEYLTQVRAEHQTTVFLTTHYLEEAEEADRICILDRGRIVALGTPEAVKAQLVAPYLLLDADDRVALARELAAVGATWDDGPPFKLALEAHAAQQLIQAVRTPLTLLRTHSPSLEDAYLEIVGQMAAAD